MTCAFEEFPSIEENIYFFASDLTSLNTFLYSNIYNNLLVNHNTYPIWRIELIDTISHFIDRWNENNLKRKENNKTLFTKGIT